MSAEKKDEQKSAGKGKLIGLVFALIIFAVLGKVFHIGEKFESLLGWVDGLGAIGPVVLAGIYILACVFGLPGSVLTLGAGALFGVVKGSIAVSIGSTLGAGAAFLVGRFLARDAIASKVNKNPKFAAIDEAVGREGAKIVFLTRLSPIFPFNLLNYGFGLTKVKFSGYLLASWIGMMPGTVMYVYIGSVAKAAAGSGQSIGQKILFGIGLVVTVIVATFVTKVAKKALDQSLLDQDNRTRVGSEELVS